MVSRSATYFLQRHGLADDTLRPKPRLDVGDLLVNWIPLVSPPQPGLPVLRGFEGSPPPDRGATRPWPGTDG